jgi:hypothetical protein
MKEGLTPAGAGDPSSGRCATTFSRKGRRDRCLESAVGWDAPRYRATLAGFPEQRLPVLPTHLAGEGAPAGADEHSRVECASLSGDAGLAPKAKAAGFPFSPCGRRCPGRADEHRRVECASLSGDAGLAPRAKAAGFPFSPCGRRGSRSDRMRGVPALAGIGRTFVRPMLPDDASRNLFAKHCFVSSRR